MIRILRLSLEHSVTPAPKHKRKRRIFLKEHIILLLQFFEIVCAALIEFCKVYQW